MKCCIFSLKFNWSLFPVSTGLSNGLMTSVDKSFPEPDQSLWCYIPASIATLAQRWPNVNPYVGPTSAHQRWANVDLSIGPTLAQRLHANVGPMLCQHRPNVGTLTLGQRWHNVMPMVVCQRCTNIGPTEAALLAFCEGNPSVTDRSPVEQTVELSNQWFETPMWSTSIWYSHV